MAGPRVIGRLPSQGGLSPRTVMILIGLVLLAWGSFSSFYQVGPESEGVVLRLGAFNPPLRQPGLHFKLPFGIDQYAIVPTQRQLKEEFGFQTEEAGVDTRYSSGDFSHESQMLTGDLNVADVEWSIQYRITDPYRFLFRVHNPRETFRYMSQAVMREIIGDRTVNEVLTIGRHEIAVAVAERLSELCEQYEIGIRVDQVILQDITPPDEVKPSFNAVNQAQQQKEQRINEARSEYNREVPKAEGQARQTLEQGEGYAIDRVNRAKGEANRFLAVTAEYRKAPEVTRRRIYLETMQKVLPAVGKKVVVDERVRGVLPLLDLGDGRSRVAAAEAK